MSEPPDPRYDFGSDGPPDWNAPHASAPETPLEDAFGPVATHTATKAPAPEAERDWSEDFSNENGDYECRCYLCGRIFRGHKRRTVCKICFGTHAPAPPCPEPGNCASGGKCGEDSVPEPSEPLTTVEELRRDYPELMKMAEEHLAEMEQMAAEITNLRASLADRDAAIAERDGAEKRSAAYLSELKALREKPNEDRRNVEECWIHLVEMCEIESREEWEKRHPGQALSMAVFAALSKRDTRAGAERDALRRSRRTASRGPCGEPGPRRGPPRSRARRGAGEGAPRDCTPPKRPGWIPRKLSRLHRTRRTREAVSPSTAPYLPRAAERINKGATP